MPGPEIRNARQENLRRRIDFDKKLHLPGARVAERVAREFRNRRGDPGLIASIETEELSNSTGPLTRSCDVALRLNRGSHDREGLRGPRRRIHRQDLVDEGQGRKS